MAFFDQYKQIDRKSVAATDKNDIKARLLAAVGDPKTKGAAAAIIRVLLDFKVAQKNANDNTAERKLATLATNVQRVNSASPPRPGSQPLTVDELQKFVRNSSAIFQKALPATFKALLEEVLPDRDVRSRLVDSSTAAFLRANGLITANDVHNAIAVGAAERPTLAEIGRWLNGYVAKQGDALETHRAQTLPLFLNQCAADFLRTNQANDKTFYRERATPHAVRVLEALHGTDSTHALRTPTFADAVPKEMRNLYVKRRIDAQSAGGPSASKGPMMARVFGDNYGPEKSVTPDPIKKLHEDRALFLKWKKDLGRTNRYNLGYLKQLREQLVPTSDGDGFFSTPEERWDIRAGTPRRSVPLATGQPFFDAGQVARSSAGIDSPGMISSLLVFMGFNQFQGRPVPDNLSMLFASFSPNTSDEMREGYRRENTGEHLPRGIDDLSHLQFDSAGDYGGSSASIGFNPSNREIEHFLCRRLIWLPFSKFERGIEHGDPILHTMCSAHSCWWVVVRTRFTLSWSFQANHIVADSLGPPECHVYDDEIVEQSLVPALRP